MKPSMQFSIRPVGIFVVFVFTTAGVLLGNPTVFAQSERTVPESCKFMVEILKESKVYGALAVPEKDGVCGLSQAAESPEAARQQALSLCAAHGSAKCSIVAENPVGAE